MAWIGGLLLAFCGLPLAIEAVRFKNTTHINIFFLTAWTLGEILVLASYWREGPLALNYVMNLVFLAPVWFFKIYPK